jgi:hypothetical protein
MIIPDLYRDIDSIKSCQKEERYVDKIPSSLPENMDISPSMVLSPSPARTDWLGQFAYGNNTQILF